MKRILFLIVFAAFAGAVSAQEASGPVMAFEKKSHDFGDIVQGDKVEHLFKFTNTGNEPLIITNIQVQCGCTAPEWPRNPIPPGGKGEIKIVFNSTGKMGKQNKTSTIVSNAEATNQIVFTGNVIEKKQQPQ
ncbi:MAG: DUF1573 domain-containing protein [Flammeovirgaceae bacterium]|nr:DUF1573 domain-containing protein [Flammeovirgaceae bacterium]